MDGRPTTRRQRNHTGNRVHAGCESGPGCKVRCQLRATLTNTAKHLDVIPSSQSGMTLARHRARVMLGRRLKQSIPVMVSLLAGACYQANSDLSATDASATDASAEPKVSEEPPDAGVADPQPEADAGASPTPPAMDPTALFTATVRPILGGDDGQHKCASCHGRPGVDPAPRFLAANPDMLSTLLSFPGMIGPKPDSSRLYTHGVHLGPAFTAAEAPVVAAWIVAWNAAPARKTAGGGVQSPALNPFAPTMGANTIDLGILSPALRDMSITFNAQQLQAAPKDPITLSLTKITVNTASAAGVHVVHPLFAIWDTNDVGTPDTVDSFSNLDLTVAPKSSAPLGPGILLLTNFPPNGRISLAFSKLDPTTAGPPGTSTGGGMTGCKNVAGFTQGAQPTMAGQCAGCHAGANPNATTAFSMVGIQDTSPASQAKACASALGEINPANPDGSRLFAYPDPNSNQAHPFKLAPGDLATFKSSADPWISSEK